jgi:hypothetical protein
VGPRAVGLNVLKRKSLAPVGMRTHGGGVLLSRRTQYIHHRGKLRTWVSQRSIAISPPSLVIWLLSRILCICRVLLERAVQLHDLTSRDACQIP